MISNTATPTPIDIWQVSTPYIAPLRSNNFSIGYFRNSEDNDIEFALEAYYRQMDNTIDYRDFAELLLNPEIERMLLPGIGKAYGSELSLQKNKGNLTGRVSYAYARTLRKVDPELTGERLIKVIGFRPTLINPIQ